LTLFLLLCVFWRRRRRQQFDGASDLDRIIQGSTGHTDTTDTDITAYSYDPQAGAGAGVGHPGYDSELGVGRAGSGPSGPSTAIWSGESGMRKHPDSQTLLIDGGVSTGGSGSRYYGLTPSESTSARPESTNKGRSNSYGNGGGGPNMASPNPQTYRLFSVQEKRQSELIESTQPSPSAAAETPFGEVMTIQHTDGGRVPDVEVAASTPEEIPPSYGSVPGDV
jgi:hypothetical protein